MTVTALEYTNGAKSACDGGLAAEGTTLTVLDGSVFPASGEFLVWVWDWAQYPDPNTDPGGEIVLCTARTGNTMTVTRAQEGTSDVTHADGERVALHVTAEGLNRLWEAVAERVEIDETVTVADVTADYTVGDLDTEAEVIAALNEQGAAINALLAALRGKLLGE
mgnify:CR=1 FL=1